MTVPAAWRRDRAWLSKQYATSSLAQIAQQVGVSAATVSRAMDDLGIERRGNGGLQSTTIRHDRLADREWLRAAYVQWNIGDIADQLGVASTTVRRALDLHEIPIRERRHRRDHRRPASLDDPGWLRARYEVAWSIREIANELGVNDQLVRAALIRHNIKIRHRGSEHPRLIDPAWLTAALETRTVAQIASELDVSKIGVQAALSRHGIVSPYRFDAHRRPRPSRTALTGSWNTNGTLKGVARDLNISPGTATVWLAEIGIFRNDTPALTRRQLRQAIREQLTVRQISAKHRVTGTTVVAELHRHGLFDEHHTRS